MAQRVKYILKHKGTQANKTRVTVRNRSLDDWLLTLPTASAIVLTVIGTAGLTGALLFGPNTLRLLEKFLRRRTGKRYNRADLEKKLTQTVYYLKKSGTISIASSKHAKWFSLTNKGQDQATRLTNRVLHIPKPSQWDRTYWLVAADIPSKTHRLAADALRRKLMEARFYPLQRTLWLHPYNPQAELQTLLESYDVAQFVTLLHVSELDTNDAQQAWEYWKKYNIFD